jgi:hypothetical protein
VAKRENRIRPIEHEQRQLENLKTLTPNGTLPEWREMSDSLIILALVALDEVASLEGGSEPNWNRLRLLVKLAEDLSK